MQKQYVIIVAGGTGSRMNSEIPKQFIELNGEAIIIKTILCFLKFNSEINIIICIHRDFKNYLENLLQLHNIKVENIKITLGGETRFHSVKNGLDLITNNKAIVGIHDAAMPFVSQRTIKNCFETAAIKGLAIPCIAIHESIRKVNNNTNCWVNRDEYKIIQTPQCFLVSKIKAAFTQNYSHTFTDDASVLEAAGEPIHLVEGNIENIKITTPHDLLLAKNYTE